MSENPYASPTSLEPAIDSEEQLAGRFTRFAAAFVDGLLIGGVLIPVQIFSGYLQRVQTQQASVSEQLGMSLLGMAVMLLLNGYLLYSRGQSIGKALTGIQIVDHETSKLLGFFNVYVVRYLWTLPVVLIAAFIPGQMDDLAVNVLILIDILLIFGSTKRCLHDRLAGSKVVLYRKDRARKSA